MYKKILLVILLGAIQGQAESFNEKGHVFSRRLRLCATPLPAVFRDLPTALSKGYPRWFVSMIPLVHIAIEVDGKEIYSPGGGGLELARNSGFSVNCSPLEYRETQIEAHVVDLVKCIGAHFERIAHYDLLSYNCGGFSRDILIAAGLPIPHWLPTQNFRIGVQNQTTPMNWEKIMEDKKILFGPIASYCKQEVEGQLQPPLIENFDWKKW